MVLGEALVDADGARHEMTGLLPVTTSFAEPRLTLGYRCIETLAASPLGPAAVHYRGHEFHYASVIDADLGRARPLFAAENAKGQSMGELGLCRGNVAGSFVHLLDRA